MTKDKQRILIAEFRGWTTLKDYNGRLRGFHPTIKDGVLHHVPNFPEDLNAMHEVEKLLSKEQAIAYQDILIKATVTIGKLFLSGSNYPIDGYVIHATSEQKAEALLRTIGKWEEE